MTTYTRITADYLRNIEVGCSRGIDKWERRHKKGIRLTKNVVKRWAKEYGTHFMFSMLEPKYSRELAIYSVNALVYNGLNEYSTPEKSLDRVVDHLHKYLTPYKMKKAPGISTESPPRRRR